MNAQPALGFGPPLIGQTEKALDAILARRLETIDLSVSGWVLLKVVAGAGGTLRREELVERAGVVSKFKAEEAEVEIGRLIEAGLLAGDGDEVVSTPVARDLQARVQSGVAEVTARLWGDLPEADLAIAGRVLETVLTRANAELGYSI